MVHSFLAQGSPRRLAECYGSDYARFGGRCIDTASFSHVGRVQVEHRIRLLSLVYHVVVEVLMDNISVVSPIVIISRTPRFRARFEVLDSLVN